MANPIKLESSSPLPKRAIDLRIALRGALQAWLASRDIAIWSFVSGTEAESGGAVLDLISISEADKAVARMNQLRDIAYSLAAQISERASEAVVKEALDSLLSEESPRFVLRVGEYPGSF